MNSCVPNVFGSVTPPQCVLILTGRFDRGPTPSRQLYSSAKQPPGQRTTGTFRSRRACRTSLRYPRVFGILESSPTQMPPQIPAPRCSANWPNSCRLTCGPGWSAWMVRLADEACWARAGRATAARARRIRVDMIALAFYSISRHEPYPYLIGVADFRQTTSQGAASISPFKVRSYTLAPGVWSPTRTKLQGAARNIDPVKSRPGHLAVTRHSVLLPETFYRRAPRAGGRPPVRDLVCSRSNEPPRSYERISRNLRRCPGRNSISAADVTNRLRTTRWTSTPSQFVNPEMTECSPAASARKPSRATRSAGSRPIERSSGTPATFWNSDAVGPGHNAQTRTPSCSTSRASASANSRPNPFPFQQLPRTGRI